MPGNDPGIPEVVRTVQNRLAVLEALAGEALTMRDLEDAVDRSRSTVNRAVGDLEDAGFVERTGGGYRATLTGRLAAEQCREHFEAMTDVAAADAALAPLDPDVALSGDFLVEGDVRVATDPAPYRAEASLKAALAEASRCRFYAASLTDPEYHHTIYERTVAGELRGESIVTPAVHEVMQSEFPAQMAELVGTGNQRVFVAEDLDYGLFCFEFPDRDPTAFVVVGDESMSVHAVVENDAPAAVRWAEERYRATRERATDVTDEYRERSAGT